ncbi:MAG: methyltransferase [Lutibacter sp.]|nr:MAG: methyltransferase [Lutibacter sp.]
MWFTIKSFILFLCRSTNQHGVHSPFVYDLVTTCFYQKTNPSNVNSIETAKQWLNNHTEQKIARTSKVKNFSRKKTTLLIRMSAYFKPSSVLEIGTSIGLETAALSIGNPVAIINTLEECKNTAFIAQGLFQKLNLKNIKLVVGNFDNTLHAIIIKDQFDLIYFNGIHREEQLLDCFNLCLQRIHNNSIFIFNEINSSEEMQQVWITIKKHPKVTISIDTFYCGIIFFRKEQQKQHFTIRV